MPSRHYGLLDADVRAAQAVIDAWASDPEVAPLLTGIDAARSVMKLRGIVAVAVADAREAGYAEGVQAGRRGMAARIRDVLESEGLT